MKSFIELWKTFAALHASCRIFWRSHFPRLTNSPTRIMSLMIFRLQVSFQQRIIRSISMIVVTITKSWIMLKISGSIWAAPNSNAAQDQECYVHYHAEQAEGYETCNYFAACPTLFSVYDVYSADFSAYGLSGD